MKIRSYESSDKPEAEKLLMAFIEMIKTLLPPEKAWYETPREGGIDMWLSSVGKPDTSLLVAEDGNGRLAGLIYGRTEDQPESLIGRWGIIDALYVAETYRRQGVAGALLDGIERWFEKQGCKAVRVDTWLENEPAIQVYRDLGFTDFYLGFVKKIPDRGPLS